MTLRFNEAPAIPPGKTLGPPPPLCSGVASFNEAPAIPPGKTCAAVNPPILLVKLQ